MANTVHIYIASDSTAANYGCRHKPMAGWGQMLQYYFDRQKVLVCNRAICGRSAKTFYQEGRLERILQEIQFGDYLFIQFGHNDATKSKPERYCEPTTEFPEYLQKYIAGARAKGAIPVLVTPMQRRNFIQHKFEWCHKPYIEAMRRLANSEGVTLLDLSTISGKFFINLGEEATKDYFCFLKPGETPNYPNGHEDNTHFKEAGAKLIADLLVGEIEQSDLALKNQLQHYKTTRVYMAGDSTMAEYGGNEEPMAGWGQLLPSFVDESIAVHDIAYCGKSSKSFLEDGYLAYILKEIQAGDYLFIQFGHNDEKLNYMNPKDEFKGYLQAYIDGARNRQAIPILLTPVERRGFDATGSIVTTHEPYVTAIKELANEQKVTLLDLNASSRQLLEKLGEEASKKLFVQFKPNEMANYKAGHIDNTHFNEYGASIIAGLAVKLLKETDLPLVKHLR